VLSVSPAEVELKNGVVQRLPNDFLIACLGGELPNEFLKGIGVSIRKHHGDTAMANPALSRKARARQKSWLSVALFFLVGTAVIAGLAAMGWSYYLLPRALRYRSAQHALLKPSGTWGHGVGILATLFMLLNFVYPLRKRLRWFKGRGSIAPWLRFHVFVGIMSPLVILFHSAFQWGNQLATTTYVSVLVVVATGLVGRYLYGWFRLGPGEAREAKRLQQSLATVVANLPAGWAEYAATRDPALHHVLSLASVGPPMPGSLLGLFVGMPVEGLRVFRGLRHAKRLFLDKSAHRGFCADVQSLRRARAKIRFHRAFKRLMSAWRSLHVVLAIVLVAVIGMHVWVSLRVGFRWLWS